MAELDDFDAMTRRLVARVERAGAEIAPAAAKAVDAELRANIAAARAPDGTPWQPTKTGKAPLRNAGKALSVKADGGSVVVTLTGVEVRHNEGSVKGGIARRILPRGFSPAVVKLIGKLWAESWQRS